MSARQARRLPAVVGLAEVVQAAVVAVAVVVVGGSGPLSTVYPTQGELQLFHEDKPLPEVRTFAAA